MVSTTEHLDTVNQLEVSAHGAADEATLSEWRAEVGVKARAAFELGSAAAHGAISENGVVATPAETAELSQPERDNKQ